MANNKATEKANEKEQQVATPTAKQSQVPTATGEFEWRCLTCGKTAPPTRGAYMGLIKHKCSGEKDIWLVDKGSGEKLSHQLQQAEQRGLLTGKEPSPKAKDEGKKEGAPEITSEGIFAYTIHLPADAFTLFNLAKFSGLEKDGGKPFDEFVWDCILARFRYDFEMQLVLAPLPEEQKRR